ncbi:MAG: hypothetical protein V7603_5622 [Micromonosporaceae bacterium]
MWLDRFGVACGYPAALAAGSLALAAQPAAGRDRWLDWASTNLANLRTHPVSALVCSAFLVDSDRLAWVLLALAGLGVSGWVLGAWRTAVLAGTAHVLGTVISEGILWWRIAAGAVPAAQEHVRDVGPSYVVIAALSAGILYAWWPGRVLCAAGFALVAPGSFRGLPHLELSSVGHTCAVLIAIGLGAVMARRRRAARPVRASGPAR